MLVPVKKKNINQPANQKPTKTTFPKFMRRGDFSFYLFSYDSDDYTNFLGSFLSITADVSQCKGCKSHET